MNTGLSQSLVEALGWTLVHFLWQGAAIAALLAGGLRLLRRATPNHRYLAGCAALLLLAGAPVVTFNYLLGQYPVEAMVVEHPVAVPRSLQTEPVSRPQVTFVSAVKRVTHGVSFSGRLEMILPWVVAAWAAGVLGLSLRLLAGWLQINRLQRAARAALDEMWQGRLAELAGRLGIGRPVRLWQSALVEVPTVIGWLRPMILLPASCLVGLTPGQLESILAHELAHIRRHDYLVNLAQSVVETVLFYHPAVWWISRQVREERENCCDDLAVEVCGDRIGYARALATLEELRQAPAQLALAAAGAPLLQRIRRLAGQSGRAANGTAWPVAGMVALVMALALVFALRGNRAVAAEGESPHLVVTIEENGYLHLGTNAATVTLAELKSNLTAEVAKNPGLKVELNADENARFTRLREVTDAAREAGVVSINAFVKTNALPETPSANVPAKALARATPSGRQTIMQKLQNTEVDSVNYDGVPLSEVINDLAKISRQRDPDVRGINFFIDGKKPTEFTVVGTGINFLIEKAPPARAADPASLSATPFPVEDTRDAGSARVTIKPALNHLRLLDVLDAIVRCSDPPVRYSVLEYAVVFSFGEQLETRVFHVDPNTFRQGLEGVQGINFGNTSGGGAGGGQSGSTVVPQVNVTSGISGATSGGGGASANNRGASSAQPGLVSSGVETNYNQQMRQFLSSAGVDLDSNNAANAAKMVVWNDTKGLIMVRATSKELDSVEGTIQALNLAPPPVPAQTNGVTAPGAPQSGVTNGQPVQFSYYNGTNWSNSYPANAPKQELNIKSKFVELDSVGGAIQGLNAAPPPVRAQTNGVAAPGGQLETRIFHVDPNTFWRRLQRVQGLKFDYQRIPEFLGSAGVDLDTNNAANAGKMFAWVDRRQGILSVRATPKELDSIEAAIAALNAAPQPPAPKLELNFKVKFVEIDEAQSHHLGLDWILKDVAGQFTTNDAEATTPFTAVTLKGTAGTIPVPTVTNSLTTRVHGVLTEEQFKQMIHDLERTLGVDEITMPEVTTEDGRQAQLQAVNIQTIVTGLDVSVGGDGKSTNKYKTETFPIGPTVDLVGKISADGKTETLMVAAVTEFLGYEDPRGKIVDTSNLHAVGAVKPLPRFRLRQMIDKMTVGDGETIVLGGRAAESANIMKSKVPLLGDLPLVGGLFRGTSTTKTRKDLLVFITPTLINPDGTLAKH